MSHRPLLIIGLDAADKDLITRWTSEGALPNFRKLMDNAIWGDVENPPGLEAGACWPAFTFGLSPAKTGQYDGSRQFNSANYEHVCYRPTATPYPSIWQILSRAGRSCAVVDVPYSYALDDINGIKIIDRAAHVPAGGGKQIEFRTYPPELAQEIVARFGPDPAGGRTSDDFRLDTAKSVRHFLNIYLSRIESKTDLLLHYWHLQRWDFFLCVYSEAHCVGHRCWHLHDKNHPDYDFELAHSVGNPIAKIYVALDKAVGRIIEATSDRARVLVYLSHGMGPGYSGTRLLDRVLARLEHRPTIQLDSLPVRVFRTGWRATPTPLRKAFMRLRDKVSHDGFQPDRQNRRFFEIFANDRTAGIRINVRGREANGIVEPGAEYEAVCERLIADLLDLTNAATGTPVVQEIARPRDRYKGERLDLLPDLLVTWDRSAPIEVVESPKVGRVEKSGLLQIRSGDHLPIGRFFAVAPDWPHSRLNETVRVVDFAPTIATLLGVDLPETDGVVIRPLMLDDAVLERGDQCRAYR
jgi:predicted AlkP superfamily phosphohydrolase/phosphomutase